MENAQDLQRDEGIDPGGSQKAYNQAVREADRQARSLIDANECACCWERS
jgi:hypothetical protein